MKNDQKVRRSLQIGGQEIHYSIEGNGPCLLLLHGFTLSARQWGHYLPFFRKNYTLLAVDLPGHGESVSLSRHYSFSQLASLMLKLLDRLEIVQTLGLGHSAGSIVLFHMLLQAPARIKALTLVAFAHAMSEEGIELLSKDKFEDADEQFQKYYRDIHPGGAGQLRTIFEYENSLAENPTDFDFAPEQLFSVHTPVLLVNGDRDFYFPMDRVLKTYQNLPQASLWTIPDQNHLPLWPEFGGSREAQKIFPDVCRRFFEKSF